MLTRDIRKGVKGERLHSRRVAISREKKDNKLSNKKERKFKIMQYFIVDRNTRDLTDIRRGKELP